MDKETKKYALIWIAVLSSFIIVRKRMKKIEEFTSEAPTDAFNAGITGLSIVYDSDDPRYTSQSPPGNILNGVNIIASELENNVVGTTQTSQPSDTNEVFIQRCVNQKPPDATHLLVTIKLPDSITQQNLNDLNGIMETTIPDGEGECKYYDFKRNCIIGNRTNRD